MKYKFPVEKRTKRQYILAFLVLFLVFIVFIVSIISIPYLFKTYLFDILSERIRETNLVFFIIFFWLVIILIQWIIRLFLFYKKL